MNTENLDIGNKNEHGENHADDAHRHTIHIEVDGEEYETSNKKMTPNEIIREFGLLDPSCHYLVQIHDHGHEPTRYEGSGDTSIKLHNGMEFQIISTGPCTVSDLPRNGVAAFVHGLAELGLNPVALPGKPDHVAFDYVVSSGKFAGTKVRHGLIVPADFPLTPPSGPHVSPHIHPIAAGGVHPLGGIHQTQATPFQEALDGQWQYWSRPFHSWATTRKTVAAYMNHIWRLWDSQ
ncbi:MAG: hypothetical protein HY799_03330 [Nitrosomonadales bacterium]|nr:hypothetical protein [Nitrosomonadales bacterium]